MRRTRARAARACSWLALTSRCVASGERPYDLWRSRVPELVAEAAERWSLRLGEPYVAGAGGHTLRAELPDGEPAVLKVGFPHRESEHEADALAVWDGDGAVRLLARDAERHALLLERCEPGTPLSRLDASAALDVMVKLLPRLWKPAGPPFRPLADEAAWWVEYLPETWERAGKPCERRLLDSALDALRTLPASQREL